MDAARLAQITAIHGKASTNVSTFVYLFVLKQSLMPVVLSIHPANVTVKSTSSFSKRVYDNNDYSAKFMTFCVVLICFEVALHPLSCYSNDNY